MTINDILQGTVGPTMFVFLFTSILSLSLSVTPRGITSALRDTRLLTGSLVTNYLAVPLAVFVLAWLLPLDTAATTGLVLYGLMAGTEGGPKFVQFAGGNVAFALGLLVVMLVVSTGLAPLVLEVFVEDESVDLNMTALFAKLALAVGLPLVLGMLINARFDEATKWLHDLCHRMSVVSLGLAVILLVYLNHQIYASLSSTEILAGLAFFALAFVLGYFLGGPAMENRRALALMTMPRNGSIAMLVAVSVFGPSHKVMVIVSILAVSSVLMACLALVWFKAQQRQLAPQALDSRG